MKLGKNNTEQQLCFQVKKSQALTSQCVPPCVSSLFLCAADVTLILTGYLIHVAASVPALQCVLWDPQSFLSSAGPKREAHRLFLVFNTCNTRSDPKTPDLAVLPCSNHISAEPGSGIRMLLDNDDHFLGRFISGLGYSEHQQT